MPTPCCPKCDNTTFETHTISPTGSRYKVNAINCRSCGAVVGVIDYYNTAALLEKIAKKLGISSLV
ncbi:hypothetical protein PSP20601_02402 [Pandoraea sputorum]|nr:hypothetical protein PSP20601_02402 [Pandoraea sputorum]